MHFSLSSYRRALLYFLFEVSLIFPISMCLLVTFVEAAGGVCPVGPNPEWTSSEKQEWEIICGNQQAIFTKASKPIGISHVIRKQFLEEVLLNPRYKQVIESKGVHIIGAHIKDPLDLSFANLSYPLDLIECIFDKHVNLRGLRTDHHIAFVGSTFLQGLNLSSVRVGDTLALNQGTFNSLYLTRAQIDGQLIMNGSTFNGEVMRHEDRNLSLHAKRNIQ